MLLTSSGGHRITYGWQVGISHPTGILSCYRPQTKFAKVMFLHLFVILFTGGVCLSACWDTTATPPPWDQTPPLGPDAPPPGAETATAVDGTHPTGMHSC